MKTDQHQYTIEETIMAITAALNVGLAIPVIKGVLIGQGYSKNKVEVMIRWAAKKNDLAA
jgi:hypothetical protein